MVFGKYESAQTENEKNAPNGVLDCSEDKISGENIPAVAGIIIRWGNIDCLKLQTKLLKNLGFLHIADKKKYKKKNTFLIYLHQAFQYVGK